MSERLTPPNEQISTAVNQQLRENLAEYKKEELEFIRSSLPSLVEDAEWLLNYRTVIAFGEVYTPFGFLEKYSSSEHLSAEDKTRMTMLQERYPSSGTEYTEASHLFAYTYKTLQSVRASEVISKNQQNP